MATSTPKSIKDEIQARLGLQGIPDKVVDLIYERRLDKGREDTLLPKIPSAQLWATFTPQEKTGLKELMEKQGLNADEVLKAHWPVGPNVPAVTKWRELRK